MLSTDEISNYNKSISFSVWQSIDIDFHFLVSLSVGPYLHNLINNRAWPSLVKCHIVLSSPWQGLSHGRHNRPAEDVSMATRSSLASATFLVCHEEALNWGQALHIVLIIARFSHCYHWGEGSMITNLALRISLLK